MQHGARLGGVACRVLGSAVEAEDVVQEVWLRRWRTNRSAAVSRAAFLLNATVRAAGERASSAVSRTRLTS
ncbi:hypothetical protein K1Y78_43340 [Streptomyces sp. tea 10]|nr:hypothetical protein [Streptomyces sp. tea 10]